jgi:DNA mismatch repair protein MutL
MNAIALLPSNVIDRIAAGEVVERPASVVKELLENALDAKASEIQISLKGGGISEIRIVDNGRGMNSEDARLCLVRHATSKIRSDADLAVIQTLGFRGEALASIAAVSDFRLETGKGLSEPGFRVSCDAQGPEIIENAPRIGTLIVASELFGNVPARRKFLKAERTELRHILDTVRRAALAHKDVGFEVDHHGKKLLKARPTQSLQARAQAVFGKALSQRFFPIQCRDLISIDGLLSAPSDAKATTGKIHIIINGRPVRDSALLAAIRQGFGPLLASGHTPQGVVHLSIDPAEVDVNVHPRKSEVRFSDPRLVFRSLLQATRSAVSETPWLETTRKSQHQVLTLFDEAPSQPAVPSSVQSPSTRPSFTPQPTSQHEPQRTPQVQEAPMSSYGQMRFMGQVANSYLLLEDGSSLILIDQHAAHELVLRAEIRATLTAQGLTPQALLFPESLTLKQHHMDNFESLSSKLSLCGFDLERGGPNSLTLRAVPAILRQADFQTLLPQIFDELSSGLAPLDNVAVQHLLACHAAVAAGHTLSEDEARSIVVRLDEKLVAESRPHGAFAVRKINYEELEEFFKARP